MSWLVDRYRLILSPLRARDERLLAPPQASDLGESYDGWWYLKYTCRLPKGTYRIVVSGEDLAGNSASVVGRATLKVK